MSLYVQPILKYDSHVVYTFKCNSNSDSTALNKWIKVSTKQDVVKHGLRHMFRHRLRAVETPLDRIDQLGGWSLLSVGQGDGDGDGDGFSIKKLSEWVVKFVNA